MVILKYVIPALFALVMGHTIIKAGKNKYYKGHSKHEDHGTLIKSNRKDRYSLFK